MAAKKSSSKFRFIEATPFKQREWINNVLVGNPGVDCNPLKANKRFFAVPWTMPGTAAVVPVNQVGAIDEESVKLIVNPEQSALLDFAFDPFDDNVLATSCQDGNAYLWRWDENASSHNETPLAELVGHEKRLLFVDFHPKVRGVVLTIDAGKVAKLWDVANGARQLQQLPSEHKGLVSSAAWNHTGSLLVTTCKDKQLRVIDPRANKVVASVLDHTGVKSSRVVWCGKLDRIFTAGFTKSPINRVLHLWDPRNMDKFVCEQSLDQASSLMLPTFDEDTSVMYLNSKGEGLIRFLEIGESSIDILGKYQSGDPASGVAVIPKTEMDVTKCEIYRQLKLTPKGQVIPIKFTVPRQESTFFQEDLYPETWDRKPLGDAESWFQGADGKHNYISLEPQE
mmetsp:Transcript_30731/g.86117  ORF Transcript_30731/g.86117 Transcript_30731/m.86117 type:complete len:396 (+) Transcript_30731:118-1305(+)|eukprot:CAMPEP_0119155218 /NCGR_PEP_ID=MMETSP1310-20130426/51635_1 /TAXON_ID=464262 /ORGANISM="Genus nov. species nov., Strain RCC2339" /LENGTH=395 /DNA_ID=CAMNT_0007147807 /DNA_START=59 /DNA_END=1246 /DNA_ORIENTATION=+